MKWISVKDRLPERMEYVLVSDGENVAKCKLGHNGDCWIVASSNDRCAFSETTHWMPLPEPPED